MKTIAEQADHIGKELYALEMQMRASDLGLDICNTLAAARGKLQQVSGHPEATKELSAVKAEADKNLKTEADGKKAEEAAAAKTKADAAEALEPGKFKGASPAKPFGELPDAPANPFAGEHAQMEDGAGHAT